ncbi:hypothetical protein EJF36_05875 [Bacillus sp. HMF5848]|uniref:sensor histidine kinase n=1 Tax=Bacillus sp. HMF5848 TaxID=2495421 RepID=UPI000F7680EB|nr:histidine kinase [Bacillus sp. HMF5848]RSK26422.1 hypothetical protein EJF36_05875 [Bacillus sp. HMF5848]
MSQITRELVFYLFGFRWVLLLISFLSYFKDSNEGSLIVVVLCVLNIVYTLALFFMKKPNMHVFISIDLLVNITVLLQTGGTSSPYILYSTTTLVWLLSIRNVKLLFLYNILYFTLLTSLLAYTSQLTNYTAVLIQLFIALGFFIVIQYYSSIIFSMFKNCIHVYKALIRSSVHSVDELIEDMESLIRSVYGVKNAYILINDTNNLYETWDKQYYKRTIQSLNVTEVQKPQPIQIENFAGIKDNYIYFSIKNKNEKIGCIIYEAPKPHRRIYHVFLYFISAFIIQKIQHISLQKKMTTAMQDKVRKKMAQDMHDGLAQQLFFLSAQMFHVKQTIPQDANGEVHDALSNMEEQLKQCHVEVRNYIKELRNDFTNINIMSAIEQMIDRVTKGTSIRVHFETKGWFNHENLEMEQIIYRVIEEAVNNVVKHAKASQLEVMIEVTSLQWTVKVRDNGVGFVQEAPQKRKSYGLVGLQERVESIRGQLMVRSNLNTGTEVVAIIPRERGHDFASVSSS